MLSLNPRPMLLAAAIAIGCGICATSRTSTAFEHGCPGGTCKPWVYGQPALFSNYYEPGACGAVPAQMYISPLPVPAVAGHTYITNEAFMPHEQLYPHHRIYHRYYNEGRGVTRTAVMWYNPPFKAEIGHLHHALTIAR